MVVVMSFVFHQQDQRKASGREGHIGESELQRRRLVLRRLGHNEIPQSVLSSSSSDSTKGLLHWRLHQFLCASRWSGRGRCCGRRKHFH